MDGYQRMMNVGSDLNNPALSAVIGSGFKNMNPAIVFLAFEAVDAMATNIHISGSAKEGLIKQKTAQKVVMRIAEELQNRSK